MREMASLCILFLVLSFLGQNFIQVVVCMSSFDVVEWGLLSTVYCNNRLKHKISCLMLCMLCFAVSVQRRMLAYYLRIS